MDKMRAILFSIIAVAVIVGSSISLSYVGLNNNALEPAPANGTATLPVTDNNTADNQDGTFRVLPESNPPTLSDAGLKVEKVIEGLDLPTSMAFLDNDDLLILQRENGRVRLVSDGVLQPNPIFDVSVENSSERGLLGVAVVNSTDQSKTVFLYYTEQDSEEVRNRVYRYEWDGTSNFIGGTLVLDLPGQPGPNHDGGKIKIGPDGMLYVVIGDLNRNGVLQNYRTGPEPDDSSVILRVDQDGNNTASGTYRYYAYGIRNSFGLDFDPLTDKLWDTENGPENYDEINVVEPGFNSGWELVMGPINRSGANPSDLVQLDGSHYEDPVFSWGESRGITDIEFLNSTKLGDEYANNIFVGDINSGTLYFFTVNDDRTGLELNNSPDLEDLVADNNSELEEVTLGTFSGGITDIETGPDGYLYILTFNGNVYRIVPAS
jgi:aldose sugar dehydrogenase